MIFSNREVRTRIASTLRTPPGELGPGNGQQHPSEQRELSSLCPFPSSHGLPGMGKGWKKPCCSPSSSPNARICKDLGASTSKCQYRPPGMTTSCNCLPLQWAVKIKIVQTISLPFFDLLKALRLGCCSSSLLLGFLDLYKGLMKSTDLLPDERQNGGEPFSPCFKNCSFGPPLQTSSVLQIF